MSAKAVSTQLDEDLSVVVEPVRDERFVSAAGCADCLPPCPRGLRLSKATARPRSRRRTARLSRAIAVNDASFRQIVWRNFDVDAIAGKNLDVMSA
jgi:hypothetical protein